MQKIKFPEAITWLMRRVVDEPQGLAIAFATRFDVSRMAASTFIKQQVNAGYLRRTGSATRPVYQLGEKRSLFLEYSLPGIDEGDIWVQDIAPYLQLSENIQNICHFGLTEMMNNANDHSQGKKLSIGIYQDTNIIQMTVFDDGIGIFKKITNALHLPDMRLALLELTKGKFTTDQKNHSGEGIFFTSRAFDIFSLSANGLHFLHEDGKPVDRLDEEYWIAPDTDNGTGVSMQISLNSSRVLRTVFDTYTSDLEELNFDKTIIPVRLIKLGQENLISRSQAKRLLQRIDRFRFVALDFSDVPEIGQAFADEIFRVFTQQHPQIQLTATHTTHEVQRMINRAIKTER